MPSRTWHTTLDGRPLELRIDHDLDVQEVLLWVDGFPTHRERVPNDSLYPQAKVTTTIDGHRLAVVVIPTGQAIRYEAALDGRSPDGRDEAELRGDVPGGRTPARLSFDAMRYYRHFPAWPRTIATMLLAGFTMACWATASWSHHGLITEGARLLWILAGAATVTGIGWAYQDYRRQRARFDHGDIRPAVVVSTEPVVLAALVDLALHDQRPQPALRLRAQPLDRLGPVHIGDRHLVVLRYLDSQDGLRWHDVDIVAAQLGTPDDDTIARLQANIPPSDWDRLDRALDTLPQPPTPGLTLLSSPPPG